MSVNKPKLKSVIKPKLESVIEPKLESVIEPKLESVIEPKPKSVIEPKPKSVIEPKLKSVIEPKPKSVIEQKLEEVTTHNKDDRKRTTLSLKGFRSLKEDLGSKVIKKSSKYEEKGYIIERFKQKLKPNRKIYIVVAISLIVILLVTCITTLAVKKTAIQNNVIWNNYRLPSFISPIYYELFLNLHFKNFSYFGNVTISFNVTERANFIVLHMVNLVKNNLILKRDNTIMIIEKEDYYLEKGQLFLKVKETFEPQQTYKLIVDFKKNLNGNFDGILFTLYNNGKVAYTNFKPNNARKLFPCFDEPGMKATFQFTLAHDDTHVAHFNTKREKSELRGRHLITTFNKTEKMSTFLLAFVVCRYTFLVEKDEVENDKEVRLIIPRNFKNNCTIFSGKTAVRMINNFYWYYLIEYPLYKLDIVVIPNLYVSGVGFWGLIFIPNTNINFDCDGIDINMKQHITLVTAHEAFHQWFGGLVTMQWWNDWWFQEGLIIYIKYNELNRTHSKWNLEKLFITDIKQPALYFDSVGSRDPIYSEIDEIKDINNFDDVNYLKAASIIRMFEPVIGKKKLYDGIVEFIKRYKFATAKSEDFWNILTEVVGNSNISEVMDTWIHQPGFPIIYANFTSSDISTLKLEQKRFLLLPPSENSTSSLYNYTWTIPFQLCSNLGKSDEIYWLNETRKQYRLGEKFAWIKLNYKSTGFYRVMYNKDLWDSLRDQIKENHEVFLPEDRSDLLDDVFSLSKNKILEVAFALSFSSYLENERDFIPWKTALYHFHYMKLMLYETEYHDMLQTHVQNLMKNIVNESLLNLADLPNSGMTTRDDKISKLRVLILTSAVKFTDSTAIEKATQIFDKWNASGSFEDPNVALYTFTGTIIKGDSATLETYWEKYRETILKQEKEEEENYFKRKSLIEGMAQIRELDILQRYLSYTLNGLIPSRKDVSLFFSELGKNEYGNKKAWEFLKQHLPHFLRIYNNTSTPSHLMSEIIQYLNTESEYDEAKTYTFRTMPQIQSKEIFFALDNLQANRFWKTKIQTRVEDWLK